MEAEVAPETAPLLVWYSGGPGGSGMIGMWTEAGPFKLDGANRPVRNSLAFTRRHNVIYLEQPCGVGFSYSNSSSAYSMDDDESARLNYVFLQRWLAAFPALQGRQLWLAGESYAGMCECSPASQIWLNILSHALRFKSARFSPCISRASFPQTFLAWLSRSSTAPMRFCLAR